ncbi:ergothioneine biosynthesis protein EgtC [Rubrobacter marinus]|uniref:Gamma-glutamyl-hercynylcysteine sulfoxide hydrolase n=1 Tax=Rubrobacter marinus TaxID=2653852 RepID=A0A6G8Q1X2_9ACTN|nr:ergothioneine biosynthesis protein EgtC [Rubrobacter marinus]QIN80410.1 ergothioneine biosynthesis protein EgtC [Rubrobacter marinus]
MCRIAAYLGRRETPLSSVVLEPEHSLLVQSYAPKEMMSGVVNADGFGCGWYAPEVDCEPAVYRSNAPMWADRSFASIAPKIRSRTVLAAVRSATPGLPAEESGVPPFASGPYLFAHNGAIKGFRRTAMRPLRDLLSDESYAGLLGVTDSETIFALLLDRIRAAGATIGDAGALAEATAATLGKVSAACEGLGTPATLNVGVSDGETTVFGRFSTEGPGNSLYWLEDGRAFPDVVVVASERFDDDPAWRQVPDRHLLVAGPAGVTLRPL